MRGDTVSAITFKCKNCGAFIEFNPNDQNFKCKYCGAEYTEQEVLAETKEDTVSKPEESSEKVYNCSNCGASIVMDGTQSSGECYYCHSPIVLEGKLSNEYRPQNVIPFEFDRKAAEKKFLDHTKKLRYLPRDFFSNSRLKELSGVYYPYFDSDVSVDASFQGVGTTVSSYRSGKYEYTTTRYYNVVREGEISFHNVFNSALSTRRDKMAEGVLPFDKDNMKNYSPAYLAGFMAERRDRSENDVAKDVDAELDGYIEPVLTQDAECHYETLQGTHTYTIKDRAMRYLMVPTWVLTYIGADKKTYYYSMNGQTGKTVGEFPLSRKKLFLHSLISGLVVAGLLLLGGKFIW